MMSLVTASLGIALPKVLDDFLFEEMISTRTITAKRMKRFLFMETFRVVCDLFRDETITYIILYFNKKVN